MHLLIAHETVYRYDRLVRSTQYLRLTPRPGHGLKVLSVLAAHPASTGIALPGWRSRQHHER